MRIDWPTPSDLLARGGFGRRNALHIALGVGCALAVGLMVLRSNLEVVRQGKLLGRGEVKEIEVFGRWRFYKDAEAVGALDILNVFLLAAIVSTTLFVTALLRVADRWFGFFLAAACGAAFFAADEALGVHETIGFNLGFFTDLTGIIHPDDVIYASYLLPAAGFIYVFRRQIASSGRALALFLLGGTLFAVGAVLDATATRGEEYVELLATAALLAAYAGLALTRVRLSFVTKP